MEIIQTQGVILGSLLNITCTQFHPPTSWNPIKVFLFLKESHEHSFDVRLQCKPWNQVKTPFAPLKNNVKSFFLLRYNEKKFPEEECQKIIFPQIKLCFSRPISLFFSFQNAFRRVQNCHSAYCYVNQIMQQNHWEI